MDIVSGIIATAGRLGMDPADLATIISYETAGTFDPTKRGPTTKWGQHRGLIQFGEPQARQYGVDWNDPLGSQLGEGGAVEKYFRSSGWKPGMSILDAYSIVNAGAPGRYNASDTAAGGAPGTVRDKVETQFGPHRKKAMALLGGEYAVPPQQQPRSVSTAPVNGNVRESSGTSPALPFGLSPPTDTAVAPEATPDQPKGTNWGTMLAMMAEPSAPPPELAPMQPVQTAQPAVPDILQALRQQRYTKAPMPFGLFPGA